MPGVWFFRIAGAVTVGLFAGLTFFLVRYPARLREAAAPGSFLHEMADALDPTRVAAGDLCPSELDDLGQLLFEHEYSFADGLGSGKASTVAGGPFRRVHGGLFGGPETMESKIFGRLTAWQNWIFQRPNAVGEEGALRRYGSGQKPNYDTKRV